LTPIFDPTFSADSYGFRPGRSTHQAVLRAREHMAAGYRWVVDLDLAKFFDTVQHDVLMRRVSRRVKDKRVLRLIGRYLRAGMMEDGLPSPRTEGTPQGGPLSPLLSNILLDDLDKELERRGHRFVRYADDFQVFVKSKAAGERVKASLERFLGERLRLKVNRDKSAVGRPWKRKFLGYTTTTNQKPKLKPDPKSVKRLKVKLKELFRRGRGWSLGRTIRELAPILRGWGHYFRLSDVEGVFDERVDPTEAARAAVAPVEAATNPIQRTPEARPGRGACRDLGLQRLRSLVERRGQPHEPGRPHQRAEPDGTREPPRSAQETQVQLMNRRIRNRTSGGVGGRRRP
jgi:RNA-directed DNA polymerase